MPKIKELKGTRVVPLIVGDMADILEKIKEKLEPLLDGTDVFVVGIKIKPTNNIKVFLDADSGFTVGMSADLNKKFYLVLMESGWFPDDDFSLEISSPGVGEPLVSLRQYRKNLGRTVAITTVEDVEKLGVITAISDESVTIACKVPKKKETTSLEIPFSSIKKASIQITF